MQLHRIEQFIAVVDAGSIRGAACTWVRWHLSTALVPA